MTRYGLVSIVVKDRRFWEGVPIDPYFSTRWFENRKCCSKSGLQFLIWNLMVCQVIKRLPEPGSLCICWTYSFRQLEHIDIHRSPRDHRSKLGLTSSQTTSATSMKAKTSWIVDDVPLSKEHMFSFHCLVCQCVYHVIVTFLLKPTACSWKDAQFFSYQMLNLPGLRCHYCSCNFSQSMSNCASLVSLSSWIILFLYVKFRTWVVFRCYFKTQAALFVNTGPPPPPWGSLLRNSSML